jgi:hypothetical protein
MNEQNALVSAGGAQATSSEQKLNYFVTVVKYISATLKTGPSAHPTSASSYSCKTAPSTAL